MFNIDTLSVLAIVGMVLLFISKKPWANRTFSYQKQTDNGETVHMSANFSIWDSQAAMQRKAAALFKLGDDRLAFVDERFKAALAAAEEAQTNEAQKVKQIK